jgi:hypothetical protein
MVYEKFIKSATLAKDFIGSNWDVFQKESTLVTLWLNLKTCNGSLLAYMPTMWWLMLQFAFDNFKKWADYLKNHENYTWDPNCIGQWKRQLDTIIPNNYDMFFQSIWYMMASVIFAYSSLESSINEIVEDQDLKKTNKDWYQRDLPLGDKIKKIKKQWSTQGIFSDSNLKKDFNMLKDSRDWFIHLKKEYMSIDSDHKWLEIIDQTVNYPLIVFNLLKEVYSINSNIRLRRLDNIVVH